MKTSDLMLGDWVMTKLEKGYQYAKVCEIYPLSVMVKTSDSSQYLVSVDSVEPVKLSPIILNKLGFEVFVTRAMLSLDEARLTFNGSVLLVEDPDVYQFYNVWYLHQLQRILKVLQIDKQFNLWNGIGS